MPPGFRKFGSWLLEGLMRKPNADLPGDIGYRLCEAITAMLPSGLWAEASAHLVLDSSFDQGAATRQL